MIDTAERPSTNDLTSQEVEDIQTVASEVLAHFAQDTRLSTKRFWYLDESTPSWVIDLIHAVHGDVVPDDWTYQFIYDALTVLLSVTEDSDPRMGPAIKEFVSIAHADILDWLATHVAAVSYVDQVVHDHGFPEKGGLCRVLFRAQFEERLDAYLLVKSVIQEHIQNNKQLAIELLKDGVA